MRKFTGPLFVLATLYLSALASAQVVTTDPVGFTTTSCLANSDTYLSIPFTRVPDFTGTILSIAGSAITVNGTPAWSTGQFVYSATQKNRYYVLIGSGGATNPKEGHIYTVTANDASSLTVDTTTDNLTGITASTQIVVIPYWTPATLFPAADAGVSFTPSTSSATHQTEIRVPNAAFVGIDLPASPIYFYSNNVDGTSSNVGWRLAGNNTTDHGDDPLLPYGYIVIRNANGAPTLPFVTLGSVLLKKVAIPLVTSATQAQDNAVGMIRPVDVALNSTGLNAADGSFVPGDQLFLFNNAVAGFPKLPSITYVYNGGWRLSSDPITDHGGDLLAPGTAMLIRKAASASGQTFFWINSPTYTPGSAVQPLQAVSRKAQGATTYDINLPLTGTAGVECRSGGGSSAYQVVISFPVPVTFSGASVTSGIGTVSTSSGSGTTALTVNLTGVSKTIAIQLASVNDGTNTTNITIPMAVLVGDTTGDGTVNSADISQTKSRSGQSLKFSNFRADVTGDGNINSADISLVKSKSGTGL